MPGTALTAQRTQRTDNPHHDHAIPVRRHARVRPAVRAISTGTVTVRGQQLRVEVRPGNGNGIPLVLCSGIGISYQVFDRLIEALDPGIEIIRFDVPGVGGSPVRAWPYGFPELAQLLAGLLTELGHQQVDLLGFSWGGALAQQFAFQYRDRCRRLVLVSTSPGALSVPGRPDVLAKMLTPKRFRGPNHIAGLLYEGDVGDHGEDVRRLFRRSQTAGSSLGYLYQLAAAASWSSLPFLPHLRQPVLVLGGDGDDIVPVINARIMAALIPNATVHIYTGGHVEPLAAAAEFAPMITRFLSQEQFSPQTSHLPRSMAEFARRFGPVARADQRGTWTESTRRN